MKVLVCTLMLLPALAIAQPTVSGISDPNNRVTHNNSIRISGTAFGQKPNAAPIKWETFEAGSNNVALNVMQPEWVPLYGVDSAVYSNADKHSGNLSACNRTIGMATYSVNYLNLDPPQSEVFISYWHKYANYDYSAGDRGTLKLPRINSNMANPATGGRYNGNGDTGMGPVDLNETDILRNYLGYIAYSRGYLEINYDENGYWNVGGDMNIKDAWFRVDMYKKVSTPGVADGACQGTLMAVPTGPFWRGVSTAGSLATETRQAGDTWLQDTVLLGTEQTNKAGDWQTYEDDVYIDNTRARVELCNASTLAASSHREIQIPTTWSSTGIDATVNTGSFPAGAACWLVVVDANGRASAGFPVTVVTGAPGLVPGQPGKPQIGG